MADDFVMMMIGDVSLGLRGPAYDKFSHEIEAMWAAQGRINRRPALQFTGIGEETINLSGCIFPMFFGLGINTLRQLENLLLGSPIPSPQLVIDGTGRNYGYFVVRTLKEERSKFLTNGAPQKQEFTLSLSRYGEDMLANNAILGNGNTDLNSLRAVATSVVS